LVKYRNNYKAFQGSGVIMRLIIHQFDIKAFTNVENNNVNTENIGMLFRDLKDHLPEMESVFDGYFLRNKTKKISYFVSPSMIVISHKEIEDLEKAKELLTNFTKYTDEILSIRGQKLSSLDIDLNFVCLIDQKIDGDIYFNRIGQSILSDYESVELAHLGFMFKTDEDYIRLSIVPNCSDNERVFECSLSCTYHEVELNSVIDHQAILEEVIKTRAKKVIEDILGASGVEHE